MGKIFNIIILIVTLLVYLCNFIPPDIFWPAAFIAYATPLVILINLILVIIYIQRLNKLLFFPVVSVILGAGFIIDSISFHPHQENGEFTVLSFNTRIFNVYEHLNKNQNGSPEQTFEWLINQDVDILCFQEYYNEPLSNKYNATAALSQNERYYNYVAPFSVNKIGEFGLAIFSRYPIINKGIIDLQTNSQNNCIYADILVGKDTVRIFNIHLHSMSIDEENVVDTDKFKATYIDLFYRLKTGFISRSEQIRILVKKLSEYQMPIIVCGDLNDIPYSYAYTQLDRILENAFTKGGNGLGFTYNGKLFFLRIDNQFFNDLLKIHYFKTHRDLKMSDHFPVSASYSFR
ncbi:endonuclease/exonuclease/phosphatase family protein [Bacteroidota bacterium]